MPLAILLGATAAKAGTRKRAGFAAARWCRAWRSCSVPEPTVSAVVTCYKDRDAVLPMHARLTAVFASLGVNYEIIFVNDASPDDADAVLKELTAKDDHVLVVEHSR